MSDDNTEEEDESISPNTSYSNGMHTLGDDTDSKDDTNLLTTDEDSREKNKTNEEVGGNNPTDHQNNGTTLQENVDLYAGLPSLEHDSPASDTDDTEYEETRDSDDPDIWIEDSLIHNTEL